MPPRAPGTTPTPSRPLCKAIAGPSLFSPQFFNHPLQTVLCDQDGQEVKERVRGERGGRLRTGCKEGSSHAGGRKEKHRGAGRLEKEGKGEVEGSGRREKKAMWQDRGEEGEVPAGRLPAVRSLFKIFGKFFSLVMFGISRLFSYFRVSEEPVWTISTYLADTLIIVRTRSLGRISRRAVIGKESQGRLAAGKVPRGVNCFAQRGGSGK